ncbi:MAG: ATP-binding protein [Desulfuromusa sp.]|nr:ATP-binding protein [Desulfuromusa sp.]
MHRSTHLKNRLPSWNLLLLALVLSGGGFFWHTTHQQQLLDQIDNQMRLTAQNIDFFYSNLSGDDAGSAPAFICKNLPEFPAISAISSKVLVYSSQGKLLCSSEGLRPAERSPLKEKVSPVETVTLETVASSQGYLRSLAYPVSTEGAPSLYLVINHNLNGLKKQANRSALMLFLGGMFILTVFAALQRKLKGRNTEAIKKLTLLMDQTDTEMNPSIFTVSTSAEADVQNLARSYNNMMMRRVNNLRRARQFTADVTHELRTPLTILRGETELALRNGRDPKLLRQVLESNLEEISRMSYLIEDLLLLSKGDLGEVPLKMEPLQFDELIVELHHQAQLLATAKNIKVDLYCPQEQIFLNADSLRLRQVFLNLLTNAIKYTPDNGDVDISVSLDEKNVATTITDTGIGMDSEHLKAIFDRFYRVDKTGNRNDGGSGLGLAIVKWIVEAHQGSIKVSSAPGKGSTFTVTFPRQQNPETAMTAE